MSDTFEVFGWKEAKPALYPRAKDGKFCDARSECNRSCYREVGHGEAHESRGFKGEKDMEGRLVENLALARWYGDGRERKPEPSKPEPQSNAPVKVAVKKTPQTSLMDMQMR